MHSYQKGVSRMGFDIKAFRVVKPTGGIRITKRTGVGVVKGNPRLCISCRLPIESGQRWIAISNGEYRIIRHEGCH